MAKQQVRCRLGPQFTFVPDAFTLPMWYQLPVL
jgi:hypothetical protein